MDIRKKLLSSIPSVDELLNHRELEALSGIYPRRVIVEAAREYLSAYRNNILAMEMKSLDSAEASFEDFVRGIAARIEEKTKYKLISVVNATGVVLHTNLGRAVMSDTVTEMLSKITSRYSNLEFNVESGQRGSRYDHVEEHICKLTGAEAAMVVNNNAAAVMLVLSTMAKGKEVIVSRGQLVEIGGSFRIPDVMSESGAVLKEVGTTNKTHLNDYKNAVNENTAAFLKVHTSNFRICGFTKEVEAEELAELGKAMELPVIEDLGSGVLLDLSKYGLPYEPTVQSSIKAGIDVVTFSGDKMLGGPQAGIIAGKKAYIDRMKKNPLTRAFRIDKLTLAALEGTLRLYYDEEKVIHQIPVLRMLTYNDKELMTKAEELYARLADRLGDRLDMSIEDEFSEVGGGSMPLHKLPTKVIAVNPGRISVEMLERSLRQYKQPVIARISRDRLLMDIRTIMEDEYAVICNAMQYAVSKCAEVI
ncbi:MAG: L-seryl-tRNA(Sec) selenium transferase [Bacillota bacterium]